MKLEQQIIFHFIAKISYNIHLTKMDHRQHKGSSSLNDKVNGCNTKIEIPSLVVHIAMYNVVSEIYRPCNNPSLSNSPEMVTD